MPSISRLLSCLLPCFKPSPSTPPRKLPDRRPTLHELLDGLPKRWPSAASAANKGVEKLDLRAGTPGATRRLLHAMCLCLAQQAALRRSGGEFGPDLRDLNDAITKAVTGLTAHERQALRPYLENPRAWWAWVRPQLCRPHEGFRRRLCTAQVENDVHRLLQSVQASLKSSAHLHLPRGGASLASTASTNVRDGAKDVAQALQDAAAEIRKPGQWFGVSGDLAPFLITRTQEWPKGLSLRIVDRAGRCATQEFGQADQRRTPVTVQLDYVGRHYSPIVNGRPLAVPTKGDCFYESVIRAMPAEDRVALFKGTHFPKGAGMAELIQVLRHHVADELERQINLPSGPPDELRALVAAAKCRPRPPTVAGEPTRARALVNGGHGAPQIGSAIRS